MLRTPILLAALSAAVALPASAEAATTVAVTDGTLTITGDGADDVITLSGSRASLDVTAGGQTSAVARARFSRVVVQSGAGADDVRVNESAAAPELRIETGAGTDVVSASSAAEVIDTGDDADLVNPGGGEDTVALGAGDDSAIQTATGDSDRIDGQLGLDTLRVLGTSESEEFTLQGLGDRARISRDTAPAVAELTAVEIADVSAGDGARPGRHRQPRGLSPAARGRRPRGRRRRTRPGLRPGRRRSTTSSASSSSNDAAVVSGLTGGTFVRVDNARAADDRLTRVRRRRA